jgi:hypothetical protein
MEIAPGAFMPAAALVGVADAESWVGSLLLLVSVPVALAPALPLSTLLLVPVLEEAPVVVAAATDPVVVVDPVLVAAEAL